MILLADLFQVGIIILCIIGLSLAGQRFLPSVDYSLHLCFTPLLLVGSLFFIEHFFPLGQAHFLWIPGSLLSVWLVRQYRHSLLREPAFWYFLFGFSLCFFYRYSFPDIHANSERVADHAHLVSHSMGGLLPAEDIWLKGNREDMYYIFQYYAAGLISRWTLASSGMTYHLGYCALTGLALAGVGSGVRALAQSVWAGAVAVVCIGLGGSGATLVGPFMVTGDILPEQTMRFLGCCAMKGNPFLTDFGKHLVDFMHESPVDAPMEYYSYAIMLGDFHPSLSSLLFFGLGIGAIGVAETAPFRSATDRYALIAGVSTAVFILISNTWISPLQVALIAAWLIYRQFTGKHDSFWDIFIAGAAPFVLIFPYFSYFAYETRNYGVHIEWVQQHVPILNWLLVMAPAVLMWFTCLPLTRVSILARFTVLFTALAMAGTYLFYVHDIYGGMEAVFNTTLKWWPWVYALTLCLGIAVCWNRPIYRNIAFLIVGLTLVGNLWIFARDWYNQPKIHAGRLDGYAWFTDDFQQRSIVEVLKTLPRGVVMESVPLDPSGPCITIAQFSGHYSLGGWVGHEQLWRGGRIDLINMADGRDQFYNGELKDPVSWLNAITPGGVNYIVWLPRDSGRAPDNWNKVNDSIKNAYDWKMVYYVGETRWGVWIRKY